MVSLTRISAVTLRHLIPTFRDPMRITDMIYWPMLDMVLMGHLAVWTQKDRVGNSDFLLTILTCVSCWYLVNRSSLEISRNLLVDIWEQHIINIFASPLSLFELIASFMAIGSMQGLITFTYSFLIAWVIFKQNLFTLLPFLAPYIPLFIAAGWAIGIGIASLILYFGKTAEMLAWTIPWFFAVTSGVFYPIDLFPPLLQKWSYVLPTTYLFEGIRHIILHKTAAHGYLLKGFCMTALYLCAAFILVSWTFKQGKKNGLKID